MSANFELIAPGLAYRTYALWCDYWLNFQQRVPPLYLSKYTADGGVLFFAPLGRTELQMVIDGLANNPELSFHMEGEWMIAEHTWFGHWCGFSAKARPFTAIPIHPVRKPKRPKGWPS